MYMSIAGTMVADAILQKKFPKSPSVVEMGNQTYAIDQLAMYRIANLFKGDNIAFEERGIDLVALEKLASQLPARYPGDSSAPLVADFYKALGFGSYTAIDINARFDSLIMDLNKDLSKEYGFKEKFDLVTNLGVSEHLFDQAVFMRNAHQLAKAGGYMLHVLPWSGYVNHGFYNFQPRLFEDLAYANDYEVCSLHITDVAHELIDLHQQTELNTFFYHYLPLLAKNVYNNTYVVALLRKCSDRPFALPIQGKYMEDIEDDGVRGHYTEQGKYDRPVATKGFFAPIPVDDPHAPGLVCKVHRRAKLHALNTLRKLSQIILRYL